MIKLVVSNGDVDPGKAKRLGRAIIYQALMDMVSKNWRFSKAKKEACDWFFKSNPGFITVCDLAGIEPDLIRARAKEIKDNPGLIGNYYGV